MKKNQVNKQTQIENPFSVKSTLPFRTSLELPLVLVISLLGGGGAYSLEVSGNHCMTRTQVRHLKCPCGIQTIVYRRIQ